MGLQRVGHDWVTFTSLHTCHYMHPPITMVSVISLSWKSSVLSSFLFLLLTPGHQWSVYGFHRFTFPECYIVGLILYVAFLHCFLSLSNTHLSFIHSVHDLKAHFCLVLSNTLTSKCTTVYPFTYLEGLLNCFQDLAINEESCSN